MFDPEDPVGAPSGVYRRFYAPFTRVGRRRYLTVVAVGWCVYSHFLVFRAKWLVNLKCTDPMSRSDHGATSGCWCTKKL